MRLSLPAILLLGVLSCGDESGPPDGQAAGLVVTPSNLAIADCAGGQVNASAVDGNGNPVSVTITYLSRDADVASVNSAGAVTGQGAGNTYIIVSSGSLQPESVSVAVTAAPLAIAVVDSFSLDDQASAPLNATVLDCHGDTDATPIVYTPSNPAVAIVSVAGIVTGEGPGATTVSLTAGAAIGSVVVEVFGSPTNATTDTVSLVNGPFAVAISATGLVYVTEIFSNKVARGTVPLAALIPDAITVGNTAAHVVFNPSGTRAYVTNQSSNSVSVVNTTTHTEVIAIPLGNSAFNLIVSPNGQTLYATVDIGTVYVINTTTNAVVDSFTAGSAPNGLAWSANGTRLFVSSRDAGHVVVYDTVAHSVVDTFVTGGLPQRMAVSRDGAELYIANESLGLDVWDIGGASRITSLPFEGYGLALSPDNKLLYVSSPGGGVVEIIDRATRADIGTITTGGTPRNIAFSRHGTEVLIANEGNYVTVVR